MQHKTIHIVFQVLNFLHDAASKKYKLLPVDKLILITLASHKGIKGIFPMQETIADELGMTRRHMRNRIKFLEKCGLLFVEKIGRKHYYHLTNLSTTEEPQFLNQETIGEPQFLSQGNYSSSHRGTTVATNNKVNNKLKKIERARKKAALALSVDFEPTRETVQEAKRVGLTQDEANYELEKFFNYYLENKKEKTDWQLVLQNWFIRAGNYKCQKGAINVKPEEVRSTVPWFNPADAQRGAAPIANLLNGLATKAREHMDKQGGKPNGLGSQGQGEKEKNS